MSKNNPVRLARLRQDRIYEEWMEKIGSRVFEVAPFEDNCPCGPCWHFVPPKDVIDMVPDSWAGIKQRALEFVD